MAANDSKDQDKAADAPADGAETKTASAKTAAKKADTFQPINPDDDVDNPVLVAVPRTPEEIAKEGTSLEESEATGGVPADEDAGGDRVWAMDAPHNVNDRRALNGEPDPNHPDVVVVP